ncbi:MAG TPA: MauE/DoxX family redox-associated membrane protein [Planctomycetota bacterium]|nr:MauE/DoxX family redox-associated membrane protein [Planctomycetota bacterium]
MKRSFALVWGPLVARLIVGGTLVYSSFHKIVDPGDFTRILLNYHVFPATWLHPLAVIVPWIEAFTGMALITGFGRRGGALLASGLFASFIVILGYNLARGCPTICGCFSTFAENQHLTIDEKLAKMHREIWLVDVPCFALSLWILVAAFVAPQRGSSVSAA